MTIVPDNKRIACQITRNTSAFASEMKHSVWNLV